jgi:hypothetical protein
MYTGARRSAATGSADTATSASVWSEDGAETVAPEWPGRHKGASGQDGGGDLIQLDSDGEGLQRRGRGPLVDADESLIDSHDRLTDDEDERSDAGAVDEPAPTPQDALRQLLKQMQAVVTDNTERAASSPIKRPSSLPTLPSPGAERGVSGSGGARSSLTRTAGAAKVRDAWRRTSGEVDTPSQAGPSSPPPTSRRANWREGRRIGVYPPPQSPPRPEAAAAETSEMGAGEEEEDSPPTPPMRVTNPFLHSHRRGELKLRYSNDFGLPAHKQRRARRSER